ncbi:MAG: hypothetical protein HC815_32580 [Richelia sp. RM1_1_1]|nr:hypothetical protein [Richelia sp. RM1_1_1]
MKSSDLVSSLIASIALCISIFSIWLQNEGAQKQLLVANIGAYTKRYQEIFDRFPKSVLEDSFDLKSLSEDDKEKLLRPMWLYFDLCYEEYFLYYDLNLIDEKLWKIWETGMKSAFSRPAFFQCWNFVFNNSFYPMPFSKFVNDKMLELHNPGKRISR